MGRPRLSVAQHRLTGTYRADRHGIADPAPTAAPAVPASRPRCPAHLSPEAKQEFRRLSKILGARRWEDEGTFVVLSVYAQVYSRWVEAKRLLAEEGLRVVVQVTDSRGEVRSKIVNHPLLPIIADLERRLLALAKSMGLSPDSRGKVEPLGAPTEPPKQLTQDEQDELAYQEWERKYGGTDDSSRAN